MGDPASSLLALLSLESQGEDSFRGQSQDIGTKRVFGGQVLGQALRAAQYSVQERAIHSIHAYFLRPGDHKLPIDYNVERTRDGGSFSARRVVASQRGIPIFTLAASFQKHEPGLEHQQPMPAVPAPERLTAVHGTALDESVLAPIKVRRLVSVAAPFEVRPVDHFETESSSDAIAWRRAWFRFDGHIPDEPDMHTALLAYLSDYGLLPTALLPHKVSADFDAIQIASIDHALWFHRPFNIDDWLLFVCEPVSTSNARGLARGSFYNEAGVLVASVVQEGLIRL